MSEEIKKGFNTNFLSGIKIVEEETQEEELDAKEILRQQHYEKSGVPSKFFGESLDTYNFEWDGVKFILEEYIKGVKEAKGKTNKSLLFYGEFGTGKTHLACGLVRELKGTYRTSFQLILEYEACGNFHSSTNKLQMLDNYSREKLLVIDEIGRGVKTDVEREILMYIIAQRYENNLPTVMVTNLDKKQLAELLGGAVVDRWNECCESLKFDGKSKRASLRS